MWCRSSRITPRPPSPGRRRRPAPGPVTFSARLYPANESAAVYGTVMASVTNDLNGRGHFSTNINGESFSGEATRVAGSSRDGVANGAGQRGSYINCRYTMNSPTLGTGTCRALQRRGVQHARAAARRGKRVRARPCTRRSCQRFRCSPARRTTSRHRPQRESRRRGAALRRRRAPDARTMRAGPATDVALDVAAHALAAARGPTEA